MKGLAAVRGWLQGKKTMLGGLVLIAAGVAGVAFGKLPVDQAAVVVGFGISVAGWAAKANRHQAQILEALEAVAQAGVQVRVQHNDAAALSTALRTAAPTIVKMLNEAATRDGGYR